MGLDIRAYSNVRNVKESNDEDCDVYYSCAEYFPQSKVSKFNNSDVCYSFDYDEYYNNYHSSYGSYNSLRNYICQAVNNISDKEFWELNDNTLPLYYFINFSDCEYFIDSKYCEIIYQDFVKYDDIFKSSLEGYWKAKYEDIKESFNIGRQDGFVEYS